ncbi:MAG: mycothiol system anti-sigma-R factor [Frankiales bacterium]|nr:mycothiol system anti-sigma-R factor [Frankiales bacterium]
MSCGNHHDTPCSEVLDAVSAYLDGEVPADDALHIAQHFDECAPCLQEFGIYQEVKLLVHRCCGDERMPDAVRERVVTRIRSVTVSLRAETPDA